MRTELLYLINCLIGRKDKFLLNTMIRCESDEFFSHRLSMNCFWNQFPYTYVNALKIRALSHIRENIKREIEVLIREIQSKIDALTAEIEELQNLSF